MPLRLIAVASVVISLATGISAQQPPPRLSSFDRGLSLTMLKQIKQDLKDNYYDPTFHGVDVDKVFTEAEARVRAAQSSAEVTAILADTLLRLDDSHTAFFPPERLTKVFYGWAITMIGNEPYVTWVEKGSDAEKKGLARGDRVLAWNRFEPSRGNLWQLNYVYRHVRPQQLQRVVVRKPDGSERTFDIESRIEQRARGELDDLRRTIEDEWRTPIYVERAVGDILVVSLSEFGDPKEVERFMKKARGYKSLVLDLRGNPGGYVDTIDTLVSWCFDGEIRIGTQKRRNGDEVEIAKGRKDAFPGNLIVLVDSRSASAAEVFARVLQIEKRGKIVGDRTAGAVMTSRTFSHSLGSELGGVASYTFYGNNITVADLKMADGLSLEKTGVTPDETVLPSAADMAAGRDPVLARAVTLLGGSLTAEQAGQFYRQ